MKKKYTAALAAALVLALALTGCAPGGSSSGGSASSAAGSGAVSAESSVDPSGSGQKDPVQQGRPKNDKVFMHGADFTNMSMEKNETYEDGTYWYEELTEDGWIRVVSRAFPMEPGWVEDLGELETEAEKLILEFLDPEAYEIEVEGAGEETLVKSDSLTYYATWLTGHNEDTDINQGVFVFMENYAYVYYFRTDGDYYDSELANIFSDMIGRVQLETPMG